jgi:hypothetical protein
MIKVHGVMAEGVVALDKTTRESLQAHEGSGAGDNVTISDEGKKRRIMGHVMACLSGPAEKKVR